jgi:hypothetical protein
VDTNVLFYEDDYSIGEEPRVSYNKKLDLIPQLQEIDDDQFIDQLEKLLNEDFSYELNVLSEGSTHERPKLHLFTERIFEKILKKSEMLSEYNRTNLSLDYAEWVPIVLNSFFSSDIITKQVANTYIFDNNTFLTLIL